MNNKIKNTIKTTTYLFSIFLISCSSVPFFEKAPVDIFINQEVSCISIPLDIPLDICLIKNPERRQICFRTGIFKKCFDF